MASNVNTQIVEIVTKFVDGASKKVREVTRTTERLNGAYERVTNSVRTLNKQTGKLQKSQETSIIVGKRFQAQWLSILFFGMAMQRLFTGLIKTSLDWVGVTELWTQTLGIFFLPVAEQLLEVLLPILDWFIDAPDEIKIVVGWIAVAGIAFGALLSAAGQLALGLVGIDWLLTVLGLQSVGNAATAAGTKVTAFGTILKILGKVAVVTIGITIAFVGFEVLKSGIAEGSILKELSGIIGIGLGGAAIGLAIGGPWGAGIGFMLGIGAGIIIDWFFGGEITKGLEGLTKPKIFGLGGALGFGGVPGFNPLGILPRGVGDIGKASPGSTGGNVTMNVTTTNNTTVSDLKEFESLLNKFSNQTAEDIRRLIKQ